MKRQWYRTTRMDEGRVAACHRLENKRRKFLIVVNDVVKSKYDVYAEYVDHAHMTRTNQLDKSQMFVKRALARQKILRKCMQMRRANIDPGNLYGRYGGKPIESFSRDIEHFMTYNHPKARRQRYLHQLKEESLDKGAILKEHVASDKIARWMERSYTKHKLKQAKKEKTVLEPIAEKGAKQKRQKSKQLKELNMSDDGRVQNLTEDVKKMAVSDLDQKDADVKAPVLHRPTLVLPPIRSTRAMLKT